MFLPARSFFVALKIAERGAENHHLRNNDHLLKTFDAIQQRTKFIFSNFYSLILLHNNDLASETALKDRPSKMNHAGQIPAPFKGNKYSSKAGIEPTRGRFELIRRGETEI